MKKVLLIYGPTSAGKSQLAEQVAEKYKGEIVNADSLQVYRELKLLSSRPDFSDKTPHHLYGFRAASEPYSTGDWLQDAEAALEKISGLPIVVGGTGLYFYALTEGLSQIPPIAPEVRAALEDEPLEVLRARLEQVDKVWAARISSKDRQRIVRGLEVYEATQIKLSDWQQRTRQKPQGFSFIKMVLVPPKEQLIAKAEARLEAILQQGVLDEVAHLSSLGLQSQHPQSRSQSQQNTALKALGFREFQAYLADEMPLAEALALAKLRTRQYIRRQLTWARHQMKDWETFTSAERLKEVIKLRLLKF